MFSWFKKFYEGLASMFKEWEFGLGKNSSVFVDEDDDYFPVQQILDSSFERIGGINDRSFYDLEDFSSLLRHDDFFDFANPASFWYISGASPLSHDLSEFHRSSSFGFTDSFSSDFSSSFSSSSSYSSFDD